MKKTSLHNILLSGAEIAAVAIFLLTHCSSDLAGGGGSEAGNARIAGIVTDEYGAPATNVIVQLLPADFDRGTRYSAC